MDDACFVCRRTQVDLDRLNEEIRTRVYLSYFSDTRARLDEQRRRVSFLQRLKDEESGDAHFRIPAHPVLADPRAYEKLMPWIDTLIEIAKGRERPPDDTGSIGALVDQLLADEHQRTLRTEQALNQLRGAFAAAGRSPLVLQTVQLDLPVDWPVDRTTVAWRGSRPSEAEPLRAGADPDRLRVGMTIQLCTVCRRLYPPA